MGAALGVGLGCEPAAEPAPPPQAEPAPRPPPRVEKVVVPEPDRIQQRDAARVADLQRIQRALHAYIEERGALPHPQTYGESSSAKGRRWDLSHLDGDGDGLYFLDFLVDAGVLDAVPLDPANEPLDVNTGRSAVREGRHYAYFVARPGRRNCAEARNKQVYLLAVTDLETEESRPPQGFAGSGCGCLWADETNFFQQQFDYVLCGSF